MAMDANADRIVAGFIARSDDPGVEEEVDAWVLRTFPRATGWMPILEPDGRVVGLRVAVPGGQILLRPFCVGTY
jgi:hypothetical protein